MTNEFDVTESLEFIGEEYVPTEEDLDCMYRESTPFLPDTDLPF